MPKVWMKIEEDTGGVKEWRDCGGNVEFNSSENEIKSITIESPDGTKWKVKVDNTGAVITEQVV